LFSQSRSIFRQAFLDWLDDKAMQMGAALAFYSVLSMAPLLMIAIAIAGLVFGEEAARGEVVGQMRSLVGTEGAEAIQAMLAHARKPGAGALASLFGIITLLFGASGVFGQLQEAMNVIWKVPDQKINGIVAFLNRRFLSFAMVLGTGFLLLVSLAASALIAAIGAQFGKLWPEWNLLLKFVNLSISFGTITLLFAMIFRLLPDVHVAWIDVWTGALVTALLFTCGKWLIGIYLTHAAVGSAYGAAGSLVVLTLWIYYSAQILLFGAEVTHVCSQFYGSRAAHRHNGG
jgi:membrane protein